MTLEQFMQQAMAEGDMAGGQSITRRSNKTS
jgi:hypothetical protein